MNSNSIIIEEQGLRDGLQNLPRVLPLGMKLDFIRRLVDAGLRRIQVTSFVHPKWVPAMADAEQLCASLSPEKGVEFSALVLNNKGVERAVSAGIQYVAASISASDTHSRKNANKSLKDAQPICRKKPNDIGKQNRMLLQTRNQTLFISQSSHPQPSHRYVRNFHFAQYVPLTNRLDRNLLRCDSKLDTKQLGQLSKVCQFAR